MEIQICLNFHIVRLFGTRRKVFFSTPLSSSVPAADGEIGTPTQLFKV